MLSGCDGLFARPVSIAAHAWPGYEPMFFAQRQGWLDAGRVTLVETTSASASLDALASGRVESAALTLDEVLRANAQGMSLSVVMVFNVSAGADMLVARSSVPGLAQLKGRSVCFEQGAVGELVLDEALRAAGLARADVSLVPLSVDRQIEAWDSVRCDACVTYEPVATRLQARGGVRLFDSSQMPNMIVDVLAVRRDVLDYAHAEAIRHLIEAHFRALSYIQRNPGDASHRMALHMHLPASEVMLAFKGLLLPDASNNRRLLSGTEPELLGTARLLAARLAKAEADRPANDLASLIRADFLPPDLPLKSP